MFLDPMNDCPDKLIWALCGWLAWTDSTKHYKGALLELKQLLDEKLQWLEESETDSTDGSSNG